MIYNTNVEYIDISDPETYNRFCGGSTVDDQDPVYIRRQEILKQLEQYKYYKDYAVYIRDGKLVYCFYNIANAVAFKIMVG